MNSPSTGYPRLAARMTMACALTLAVSTWAVEDKALLDPGDVLPENAKINYGARVSSVGDGSNGLLRIEGEACDVWPGFRLPLTPGPQNWSGYLNLAVDVKNAGDHVLRVGLRWDGRNGKGETKWTQELVALEPGQATTIECPIRYPEAIDENGEKIVLPGMRSGPWGRQPYLQRGNKPLPDTANAVVVFAARPEHPFAFEIDNVRLTGDPFHRFDGERFFPFCDAFGQYVHIDYPGKIHSMEELRASLAAEEEDLAACPGPAAFDKYGGWKNGPTLEATGHFRTAKHDGRWWLVDPEGKLFFSWGINGVRIAEELTPVTDRETWFADLPSTDDPDYKPFFGPCRAAKGDLAGKAMTGFSFGQANMFRRYGPDWRERANDMAHRRLRSWGMNTLGNWTDHAVALKRRTPYAISVHYNPRTWLGDPKQLFERFPDAFDPAFEAAVRKRLAQEVGKTAGDPWLLGYFIDNELNWHEARIGQATLGSSPDQPGKIALVDMLKARYSDIARLNESWKTGYTSWQAVLDSREHPDAKRAAADYSAFLRLLAEQYFSTVRAVVKDVAPDNLYLGCRFNTFGPEPAQAAARHCDVVSYNFYRRPNAMKTYRFPTGADVPIVIGEWHFGASDRGHFWGGIVEVENQAQRAQWLKDYLRAALARPDVVGVHWFRYRTQPLTGRPSNGENGQLGFVDICDIPYPETIAASREVAETMYTLRSERH